MATVSLEDLYLAADWLGTYEESDEEREDPDSPFNRCKRVADMLLAEAKRREKAAFDRRVLAEAASQLGISVAEANRRMAAHRLVKGV